MARKTPTTSVIKRLFATSGNLCAFKKCTNSLIDENGNVLGEICHIEGASKNGPRYNVESDDEYRRSFDNLILLCARHHKIVDNNSEKYSASYLAELKIAHQDKFSNQELEVSDNTADKFIQKIKKQQKQRNTNSGNGQQYNVQAKIVNITNVQDKDTKSGSKEIKNKIELTAAILSTISIALALVSQFTNILPNLSPYLIPLLIFSSIVLMILFGYIVWSKSKDQTFSYSSKKRTYGKIAFLITPLLAIVLIFAITESNKEETYLNQSIVTIIEEQPTKNELIAKLYNDKDLLFNHLKNENYEDILILSRTEIEKTSFDLVLYFHNDEMNQMGRPMLFINFYDINTDAVDWNKLDNDWENISTDLSWEIIKSSVEKINGFKYSLERSTPLGVEKPILYFVQLVGRRDALNQFDLATMQNNLNMSTDFSPFKRIIGTYDYMLEKFRPPLN